MSKKTSGTDIGYRAYFAAFAIMVVIVLAAVCILSGCLDSVIFKAEKPAFGSDSSSDILPPTETGGETDTKEESDESHTSTAPDESTSDEESKDTSASEITTEPESEEITTEEITTDKITTPALTTPEATTPEQTTPETTPPEVTTEKIDRAEIITDQDNSILYSYDQGGLIITGYDGNPVTIVIAKELDGVEVSAIGNRAFSGNRSLVEVKLSAGIKTIGARAFENCSVLTYVYIPTTVKEIASNAFDGCGEVIIYCAEGSYAEHFASDNGIEYRTN